MLKKSLLTATFLTLSSVFLLNVSAQAQQVEPTTTVTEEATESATNAEATVEAEATVTGCETIKTNDRKMLSGLNKGKKAIFTFFGRCYGQQEDAHLSPMNNPGISPISYTSIR
ncbi:MAG: hypothetical protein AAGB22_04660 [Bacteroidota bacterium]